MVVLLYAAEVVPFTLAVLTITPRIKLSIDIVLASMDHLGKLNLDDDIESEVTLHNREPSTLTNSPAVMKKTVGRSFNPRRSTRLRTRII
jgi:hypothetical protein